MGGRVRVFMCVRVSNSLGLTNANFQRSQLTPPTPPPPIPPTCLSMSEKIATVAGLSPMPASRSRSASPGRARPDSGTSRARTARSRAVVFFFGGGGDEVWWWIFERNGKGPHVHQARTVCTNPPPPPAPRTPKKKPHRRGCCAPSPAAAAGPRCPPPAPPAAPPPRAPRARSRALSSCPGRRWRLRAAAR